MGVNTGTNVAAAKPKVGGGIYFAPLGTALPTDATTALAGTFIALGPVSEDGVQPSRDTNVDKIKEWDGSTLAQLLTDESRSFEIKFYGVFDADVQKFLYGTSNVTVTAAVPGTSGTKLAVLDKGGKPDQCVLVLEMLFGGKTMRKVIPIADCVVTDEEPYQGSALMGYTLTVEALKDTSSVRVYEYYQAETPSA